jgi:hypothetical protein
VSNLRPFLKNSGSDDATTSTVESPPEPPVESEADAWTRNAARLAEFIDLNMVNRRDVWGLYKRWTDKAGAEQEVMTAPAKRRRGKEFLNRGVIARHFLTPSDGRTIGLHSTSEHNFSSWGAIDIDHHGEDGSTTPEQNTAAAIAWCERLREMGFQPLLEDSNGNGGFHLLVIFDTPIPARDVYAFLQALVADFATRGFDKPPETFPKQPDVKEKFGNWLRLAGKHPRRDHFSRFYDAATGTWRQGQDAIDLLLTLPLSSSALVPTVEEVEATPEQVRRASKARVKSRPGMNGQAGVIDEWNRQRPLVDTLKRCGYTRAGDRFIRAGGRSASVTIFGDGPKTRSFHHSDNDPLRGPHAHDSFSVFCECHHGGDVKAAVKAAASELGIVREPELEAPMASPTGCVLVPGAHVSDQGEYTEVGNHRFASEVLRTLPRGALYRRGQIVGDIGRQQFRQMQQDHCRLLMDTHVRLGRWSGKKDDRVLVYEAANRNHAGIVLAAGATDPHVRGLTVITPHPVYLPGFELASPGWKEGVFYDEPPDLAGLSPEPDAGVIRDTLEDLLIDFPFKDEASRINFIGVLFTIMLRLAIVGNTPMAMILASLERTGKSKLAEVVVGLLMLGGYTPAMQLSAYDEENDKRILSLLLTGGSVVHLDNLKEHIDSPSLASLLTASVYRGRLLGSSQMVELPNTLTLLATGNNVKSTGEIAKRCVPIILQPQTDAPERRTDFVHPDLDGYVRRQRRAALACLIGAVELWKRAGQPAGDIPMGGFEHWARTVGGVLKVLGYDQWLGNVRRWVRDADPRGEDLRLLVDAWYREYQSHPVTTQALHRIAEDTELFTDVLKAPSERGRLTAFAMRVLARNVDTPVGGWIIRRQGSGSSNRYYLERSAYTPERGER